MAPVLVVEWKRCSPPAPSDGVSPALARRSSRRARKFGSRGRRLLPSTRRPRHCGGRRCPAEVEHEGRRAATGVVAAPSIAASDSRATTLAPPRHCSPSAKTRSSLTPRARSASATALRRARRRAKPGSSAGEGSRRQTRSRSPARWPAAPWISLISPGRGGSARSSSGRVGPVGLDQDDWSLEHYAVRPGRAPYGRRSPHGNLQRAPLRGPRARRRRTRAAGRVGGDQSTPMEAPASATSTAASEPIGSCAASTTSSAIGSAPVETVTDQDGVVAWNDRRSDSPAPVPGVDERSGRGLEVLLADDGDHVAVFGSLRELLETDETASTRRSRRESRWPASRSPCARGRAPRFGRAPGSVSTGLSSASSARWGGSPSCRSARARRSAIPSAHAAEPLDPCGGASGHERAIVAPRRDRRARPRSRSSSCRRRRRRRALSGRNDRGPVLLLFGGVLRERVDQQLLDRASPGRFVKGAPETMALQKSALPEHVESSNRRHHQAEVLLRDEILRSRWSQWPSLQCPFPTLCQ